MKILKDDLYSLPNPSVYKLDYVHVLKYPETKIDRPPLLLTTTDPSVRLYIPSVRTVVNVWTNLVGEFAMYRYLYPSFGWAFFTSTISQRFEEFMVWQAAPTWYTAWLCSGLRSVALNALFWSPSWINRFVVDVVEYKKYPFVLLKHLMMWGIGKFTTAVPFEPILLNSANDFEITMANLFWFEFG